MNTPRERLYHLLPAVYRQRDAELGEPLRALLGVMEAELETVEANLEALYESWFIETAPEWVIPYLGELIGNRPLTEVAHSRRTDVARTLYYRRRKGTVSMLEELARDVTGWGAHAVEFMERLGWTQNLNHLRYTLSPNADLAHPTAVDRVGTVNLRSTDRLDRLGGAWDEVAHSADVRRAPPGTYVAGRKTPAHAAEGWYGVRKLGFFFWRLRSYPLAAASARRAAPPNQHGWHCGPLGTPAPLFTDTRAERDPARLAREIHVPAPIRPLAFHQGLEAYRARYLPLPPAQRPLDSEWYGPNRSLNVIADGEPIPPEAIVCMRLDDWARPPAGRVAVDVRRGRISFAAGEEPAEVQVDFAYGFSADLGGGPYDRRATLQHARPGDYAAVVARVRPGPTPPRWHTSIAAALADWDPAVQPRAVITIADSGSYDEQLSLRLAERHQLIVQAGDRQRPHLRLRDGGVPSVLTLLGGAGEQASLTLDGLLIEGGIRVEPGGVGRLEIRHCTLVPGHALDQEGRPVLPEAPSIYATAGTPAAPANAELEVVIERSIIGALRLPELMRALTVRDSIVDRPAEATSPAPRRVAIAQDDDHAGPSTRLQRVTVFGELFVRTLDASDCLFLGRVEARRRQTGCIRYSYVDDVISRTPRRFRCQPELALETRRRVLQVDQLPPAAEHRIRARLRPDFTSIRYGDPGYAQLHGATAEEIHTGAESGAEMGAYEHLEQAQREVNLRIRLDEYMPYGLEAGIIHVT